jgi:ribosomal protein S18 acetylase RimI-like enzyme
MAPAPQAMAREGPQIQVLTLADMEGAVAVLNEGFGSKTCCCCIPGTTSVSEVSKRYTKCPAKLSVSAIAKGLDGTVNGVLLVAEHGMPVYPAGIHTTKPGEIYIEQIAVSAAARGQGVGGKLLDWCESVARERGAKVITLAVLRGNPAIKLYKRKGFAEKPEEDECEYCCGVVFVCCLMGRPYGLCSPHVGAFDMQKLLV